VFRERGPGWNIGVRFPLPLLRHSPGKINGFFNMKEKFHHHFQKVIVFLPLLGSSVAVFFGRFLGSEGTAIMTKNILFFSIILLGCILFLQHCVQQKIKSGFPLLFLYISVLFFISIYCYSLRIYCLSCLDLSYLLNIIWSVSEGEVVSDSGGSKPGGGSSRDSGWTNFDLDVLAEPFYETEMEGTSVNSSIPRCDEAGPSHQGSVVPNASLEASLHNRVQRLERDNSPFLLDKAKGDYWQNVKLGLEQAASQSEYNCLLDFESRDLQIRERRHNCLSIFQEVLSRHPSLAEEAPYNPKEAFMDFLDQRRDLLDQQQHGLPVWKRDALELNLLDKVRQGLQDGGPAYVKEKIFF